MNETYQNVVVYFPPEKSPEGDAVILKFQTRSGEVLCLLDASAFGSVRG